MRYLSAEEERMVLRLRGNGGVIFFNEIGSWLALSTLAGMTRKDVVEFVGGEEPSYRLVERSAE